MVGKTANLRQMKWRRCRQIRDKPKKFGKKFGGTLSISPPPPSHRDLPSGGFGHAPFSFCCCCMGYHFRHFGQGNKQGAQGEKCATSHAIETSKYKGESRPFADMEKEGLTHGGEDAPNDSDTNATNERKGRYITH